MAVCGASLQVKEVENKMDSGKKVNGKKPVVVLDEKKEEIEQKVIRKKKHDVHFWGRKIPLYVAKSIFMFFDKNKNGKLSSEEWNELLECYGMENYVKELEAMVDADGGGDISWREFQKWLAKTNYFIHDGSEKADTKLEVLVALGEKFDSYDTDNDGYITIEEFSAVKNDWQYPVDKNTFFKLVDKDGNNRITFNEYYNFFFHPYMKNYYPTLFGDTIECSNKSLLSPRKQLYVSAIYKE